jgi:hypothetical protein
MPRPTFSKKLTEKVYMRLDNPNGIGYCWHCGKKLVFNNRKIGLRGAWHMDHYPVVYRDIENQCCVGVTDPIQFDNIVPSCAVCNLSHQHEKSLWCCCGRSQCKCESWCTSKWIFFVFVIILLILGVCSLFMECSILKMVKEGC